MENKNTEDMTEKYFQDINKKVKLAYDAANKARKKGYDPEKKTDVPLAKNMAERVEGLLSVVSPEIVGAGIPKRKYELEKKYSKSDWRVAL